MEDQLMIDLPEAASNVAQKIYNDFCDAILTSNKGYDTNLITLEHKGPASGDYDVISISKTPVFRIQGKKKMYLYFSPKLVKLFQDQGIQLSKTKSDSWHRIPVSNFNFVGYPDFASSVLEKILLDIGFGCCSRYVECSDAKHCIHPDIMFAVQCAYRQNLHNGKIFYGKNRNIDVGTPNNM